MKKFLSIIIAVCICFFGTNKAQSQEKEYEFYDYVYPSWFENAKLGIMIHYGLYSIPSYSDKEQYSEWFYKGLISSDSLRINFQKNVFGENFDYFDYMKLFKAEMFDAEQWAKLFKVSGAKYIVFTTKHHDGFCLYPSAYTKYNVMNTPARRDIVGELAEATRKEGLRLGLYYSLTEWTNPLYRWTVDKTGIERYVTEHMVPQFKEIVDRYQPSIVFADGDWDFNYKTLHSEECVQYLMDKVGKDEVIVNNRWGNGFKYGHKTPEYSSGIKEKFVPWAECRSLSRSFALNRNSSLEEYLSPEALIEHFVQLVSLGGGLMLNVAPAADGQIPLLQQERLLQLGKWLEINQEAIYNSQSWEKNHEMQNMIAKINSETIDFDWVRNGPIKGVAEDNFSIDWHGTITPEINGLHFISLEADDEATIEILHKGKVIYSNMAKKDYSSNDAVKLKKGETYEVNVYYKEVDIDASCHLYWSANRVDKTPMRADKGWKGEVSWQSPYLFYTKNGNNLYAITMQKLDKTISFPLEKQPDSNMKIVLLGNEDQNLDWQYKDGNIVIDLSVFSPASIKSEYAWTFKLENYLAD